jgi:uncharacterized protein (DUF58 family)
MHVLDKILRVPTHTPAGETELSQLFAHAQSAIGRRSVVFVVSDFISKPGWEKSLSALSQRHEVVAVRLYDPMEMSLPDLGVIVLQDAETGEQMLVDTSDAGFRERFNKAGRQREAELRQALATAGVDCLELSTEDRLDEALLHFTRMRKRRSQLGAGGIMSSFGAG